MEEHEEQGDGSAGSGEGGKLVNFRHGSLGEVYHRFTVFFNCIVGHIHCLEQACPKLPQKI
jgi:hypothetical protein